jgi:ATP-binding cassette subfamily C (CFTR/MRP) protein 4
MGAFVALEKPITTEIVYFMFATYRTLSYLLGIVIPFAACHAAQVAATVKRIDEFLTGEETQHFGQPFSTRILLEDVNITLKKNTVLKHLNLNLKSDFVLIGGAVGSGKTVLLKTILGEFPVSRGNVVTQGSISYASQEPWLFPATIKQNILFGERFDEKRYNQVLKVCGLMYDLQLLQNGDESIVEGGQGVVLSRGQRSCVNLARAIYKNSDIYLLDDCLASLDWLTSCYIFDQLRQFLQNKLVVVVTQDARFFDKCPNAVVLIDSEISSSGFKPMEINRQFATGPLATEEKIVIEENERDELLPTLRTKNIFEETHKKGHVEYRIYGKWSQTGGGVIWLILVTSMVAFLPVMVTYVDDSISSW